MKKALIILFFVLLLGSIFATSALAEGDGKYLISEEEGVFSLSVYDGGEPLRIAAAQTLGEILTELARDGGAPCAVLDSIEVSGDVELPRGNYTLAGTLHVSGGVISVPSGAAVAFSGISLTFSEGGYLRIKGGSVSILNSYLEGEGKSLVVSDYSATSSLDIMSGELSASAAAGAIAVRVGSLSVCGGKISNDGGAAIITDTGMRLSGTPIISGVGYDVVSSHEISLSSDTEPYSGELSLSYTGEFSEGTMTELFYLANPDSIADISVFDRAGKEYELTHFEESTHTQEKNFAAVYLPFFLKYFVNGNLLYTESLLEGELPTLPQDNDRTGYKFLGWYSDGTADKPYERGPVISSFSLYARYELLSPDFSISSLSVTYDGAMHELSFDTLTHPLVESGGFFTYEWRREGALVSTAPALAVREVSDSGSYSVTVSFHYGSESVSVLADGVGVTVAPCVVRVPEIPTATYTGVPIYPAISPSSYYTYGETFGIGAGCYPVTLTLLDPENYRWESSDTESVTLDFLIERANNLWVETPEIYDSYVGFLPRISGVPLFGAVEVLYSLSEGGAYTASVPTEAGEYYAKLRVTGCADYSSLESLPQKFRILAEEVVGVSIERYANRDSYTAFEDFSPDGLLLRVTYNSGREETVGADRIKIFYNTADSLRVGDRAVTLSYGGVSTSHPVTVMAAEYDLSGISFSDTTVVYDGSYHTVDYRLPGIVGLDGLPLKYTVRGGGTGAGSYSVTLEISTDSTNYKVPDSLNAILTVKPREVGLVWSQTSFTYDGEAKCPSAVFTDVLGIRRYPNVLGARYNAGEGYSATAIDESGNYTFTNSTCLFDIAKADYDTSGAYWTDSSFVYNGDERGVRLLGLPSGVRVVGYTDATASEAGIYTARATVDYDKTNYNCPDGLTHTWVIYPAEYDVTGFDFPEGEFTYDGSVHYPELSGTMPTGADGISLSYSFSRGVTNVNEGRVAVTVRFYTDSKNYVAPSPITTYVRVLPKRVSVFWQVDDYVYDGKEKLPRATSPECAVRVVGGGVNAGVYTAVAESLDSNCSIINPSCEFEIKKAANFWITAPSLSNIFEGEEISVLGETAAGVVGVRYFYDLSMTMPSDTPTLPGKYYAVVYAEESKNYLGIASEPMAFEIIEVVPVGLTAELLAERLFACTSLGKGDIKCTLHYNNGRREDIDFSLVTLSYQNGECLYRRDTSVDVSYSGFTATLPVTVLRSDYDISGVRWEGLDTVYDGEAKTPTLVGLPAGVRVLHYEGGGKTEAGEYSVYAVLDYDKENFNPPTVAAATLLIRKKIIAPTLSSVVYDGSAHVPKSDSPLYYVVSSSGYKNAGRYSVEVRVTDSKNYSFADGEAASVSFTVLPKTLDVTADDVTVYLFESPTEFELALPDGVVAGDEVRIVGRIEGDRVAYSTDNPNYTLNVTHGEVIRVSYPSPAFTWTVLFVILFILLITLFILVVYYRHDDILAGIAAARCKRNMIRAARLAAAPKPAEPQNAVPPEQKTDEEEREIPEQETHEDAERDSESSLSVLPSESVLSVDVERADELITDSLAKDLLKRPREFVVTSGSGKSIINVDTLSQSFECGERVDVNLLKEKSLVPYDTAYIKVLARGAIDKPLSVYANDFSLAAIKMIALSGGEAVKVVTVKEKHRR